MVTRLERHDRHRVAEANQLTGKSFHVPFEAANDGPVEITQLENVHRCLHGRNEQGRLPHLGGTAPRLASGQVIDFL
jgi:hypothetical protein